MANEKRLIDANDVYSLFDKSGRANLHVADIDLIPRVDAVEVVHGRWKYYHKQNKAVCTNCYFERDLDENFGRAVSCPNCGAKMDGDGNV